MSQHKRKKRLITLSAILIISLIGLAYVFLYNKAVTLGEKGYIENIKPTYMDFSPEISNEPIQNPYIGFVRDARRTTTPYPVKLAYAKLSWAELENKKGTFDFAEFEKKNNFSHWKEQGVNLIIRFYMDEPEKEKHINIPLWLYNEIGSAGVHYNRKGKMGFSPDYNSQALISYHKAAIEAIAKRYNNEDLVAYVEMGSIGHWGEWHTTYVDEKTLPFPKTAVTDEYVKHYLNSFPNKILMMRRPFAIAKENNLGLFNDSFGDIFQTEDYFLNWIRNGYQDRNTDETHPKMSDFWKNAPSGGEFGYYPGTQFLTNERIERTLKQLEDSHTSWLGPSAPIYDPISQEEKANLEKVGNRMGYRFSVKDNHIKNNAQPNDNLDGYFTILNSGIAPFYFNWALHTKLFDRNNSLIFDKTLPYDMKNLLPGQTQVPYSFPIDNAFYGGIYTMYFGIKNPKTDEALTLANKDFSKENGIFCGETTIGIGDELKTDSFKYENFYNYINFTNNILTIKAINKDVSKGESDKITLYKTKEVAENFTLCFNFDGTSDDIKVLRLFADAKTFATLNHSDTIIKLTTDKFEKEILKTDLKNLKLTLSKVKNNYKLTMSYNDEKEQIISNEIIKSDNQTQNLGLHIELSTKETTLAKIGNVEFK